MRIAAAEAIGNQKASPAAVARLKHKLKTASLLQNGVSPEKALVMAPPPAWRGMPTSGTVKMFTLLIDFSDYPHSVSSATFNSALYGDGDPANFPTESLRNFYRRSSYNQLEIQGNVLGWHNTGQLRSVIPETYTGREDLIKQALNFYDSQGHDFSQYDNDGDGKIDYFAVIWTGPPGAWASFWWAYKTGFSDSSYSLDGKKLFQYSWQWEDPSPRVLIHETGHALGLPDYYDYDGTVGPDGGLGGMDMMDSNWGDHNAFSKFMLGWLSPANSSGGSIAGKLRPSDAYPDALKMMTGSAPGEIFSEFYMVQNRRQAGNDQNLPGSGLLIWHVDARLNGSGQNFAYNNSGTDHKLLRLMEADGLEEIEANGIADAGDFYTAGKAFTPESVPNSNKYDGGYTGIIVSGIGGTSDAATFYNYVYKAAVNTPVTITDNVFRPLKGGKCSVDLTAGIDGHFTIKAYTANGSFVKTIFDGQVSAGHLAPAPAWDGRNDNGAVVASGLYLLHVAGPGADKTLKVVIIK